MKKNLICFVFVFLVVSSFFVCYAIGPDDIPTSYDELPDSVIDKCHDIVESGKYYIILKSNYFNGIYFPSVYNNFPAGYYVFSNDEKFHIDYNTADYSVNYSDFTLNNYDSVYIFQTDGTYWGTISVYRSPALQPARFNFIATNIGLYNSNDECLFYRSTLPLGQTVKLHYKDIIFTISSAFCICLVVIVGYISIRKAISFIRHIIKGV